LEQEVETRDGAVPVLGLFEDLERSRAGDAHPAPEQWKLRFGPSL
jgi:hypothetical protein